MYPLDLKIDLVVLAVGGYYRRRSCQADGGSWLEGTRDLNHVFHQV